MASPPLDLARPGQVTAVLGPTNTGKTHRALERMLQHRTGMIGLPLRLLAREVYERLLERRGPQEVALITGEEKRIPPSAKYFVCTVEAMPVDRPVAFLAVDEIQLAGDRNRGHTFTDRLLHARGVSETWFLGSDTMEPLLTELIPGLEVQRAPRLSLLSHVGVSRLVSVPKRSAVIAFTVDAVYEQAERLRAVHGGAAVVLGALSPRARNAQVALYQSGEVAHLVATDAIGMGLNMDISHVAFTQTRKYDGRHHRALSSAELAQIAGRAGRYTQNGTFGSTRDLGPLEPAVVEAIEQHAFPPVTRLFYRNSRLDFESPAALLQALAARAPHPALFRVREEADEQVLADLARRPELARLITGPAVLERLWEICRVPDYRKTLTTSHADFLAEVATFLLGSAGQIPAPFAEARLRELDRLDGDIDLLTARIAGVRVWTYLAHQGDWVDRSADLQQQALAVEDRLSDALHQQLTQRFVDRVALGVRRKDGGGSPEVDPSGQVLVNGGVAGRLDGLTFTPATGATAGKVGRRLAPLLQERLAELVDAEDRELELGRRGELSWRGGLLGRLDRGEDILRPQVRLAHLDPLDAAQRQVVRRRLERAVVGRVDEMLGSLRRVEAEGAERALLYALEVGLGTVARVLVEGVLDQLPDRGRLARWDIRVGADVVYVVPLLKPRWWPLKTVLWSVFHRREVETLPEAAPSSFRTGDAFPASLLWACGYAPLGPRAVRVDLLERVSSRVRAAYRAREPLAVAELLSWLGCPPEDLGPMLHRLGFDLQPRAEGLFVARAMGMRPLGAPPPTRGGRR